jgi:hypothetical protein
MSNNNFSFLTNISSRLPIDADELNRRLLIGVENRLNNVSTDNSDLDSESQVFINNFINTLFLEKDRYKSVNEDTTNIINQFLKQQSAENLINIQTSRQLISNQVTYPSLLTGESKNYVVSSPSINNILNNYIYNKDTSYNNSNKDISVFSKKPCNKIKVNKISLWPRTKLECVDMTNTKQQLDERYKAEVLRYKHLSNHTNNTKKFKWQKVSNSLLHKRGSVSNSIQENTCNKEVKMYSSRQSNIPGNSIFISYNERVPYIKKQNTTRVNSNIGHNYNNYVMGVLR